jgi:hypothetical protein
MREVAPSAPCESGRCVQRLDENFVHSDVRRLGQSPHDGCGHVARVKPHVPVPAALRELRARGFVRGAGGQLGVRVAWLHTRNFNPRPSYFLAQALADPLHKELGSRVPDARSVGRSQVAARGGGGGGGVWG